MADPVNAALTAELLAHIEMLKPQIAGLEDLEHVSLSAEVKAVIHTERADRERRVALCNLVLTHLNNATRAMADLEADGYPDMPPGELDTEHFSELVEQQRDFAAAFAQLVERLQASLITINLGTPAKKS